ncbi:MAG: helix-turn-helix transcriptional regulator [Polyangiaceae bacterium]
MAAMLCFDRAALDVALKRVEETAEGEARLEQRLDRAWRAIADGEAAEDLGAVERDAARLGLASLVVRAAAARALAAATSGALDEALEVARRASRMGRTEALPEAEYLAALVLARVRRLMGRPYLANRILTALAGYAPPPWHGWIGWELLLASGRALEGTSGAAATLLEALAHLDRGHAASWRAAIEGLMGATSGVAFVHRDVARLRAALDPTANCDDPALARWRAGEEPHDPPHGLLGLHVHGGPTVALVLAGPGLVSRRLLDRGAPLVRDATAMTATARRQARIDGLLAALAAVAPAAIDEADLFRTVYGFKYARNVHKEVLHVALHRARERLGTQGEIHRDGSLLHLTLVGPTLFPDPRCVPAVDDRVLQLVAKRGSVTAKDAAGALGIPLRSAQSALKELVEGGACTLRRDGRKVAYEVEDTTFREPTFA